MLQNPEELLQRIKELESELKKVKSCKRYGLVWEDKPEIFEEKAKNALPILKEDKKLRLEDDENKPNNIIIEGDNYHSLSALSYTHKGKIDVIYIDPPYNTGNKDFIYNDNRILKEDSYGNYVPKDDPYRHSKWLSFMNKRLRLAKELLSDNGVIFMSIDDNEQAQLKLLCDEIFGGDNFISKFIWNQKITGGHDSTHINIVHEYVYLYSKNKFITSLNKDISDTKYNLKDEKTGQYFKWDSLWTVSHGYTKNCDYPILSDDGIDIYPWMCHKDKNNVKGIARWFWSKETYDERKNELLVKKDKKGDYKVYKKVFSSGEKPFQSIFVKEDVGGTSKGKKILEDIFNQVKIFNNPKSILLIKHLLKISSNKNSVILDFFAGSGTTGHAVMELNKEDGGSRQFILCSSKENSKSEPDKNICRDITYERNKRVIEGYTNSKGEDIKGLGGNLRYYTNEFIKADKSIDDLRYSFIDMCDDLLCIKENTFTEVNLKNSVPELRLFKKGEKFTAILYDIHHFTDLVKLLKVLDGEISVYIFSLSKDIFEEELEYLDKKITVQNIPDDILQTYKKIFEF